MESSHLGPLGRAVEFAAPLPGERVLDLSGRAGAVALQVAATAASVEAVQPDAELAAEGRRLAVTMGRHNVFFHACPLHDLPFDRGQFDVVLWCMGLGSEPRPLASLAEARRVLAPGGRVVLQDVTAFGLPRLDLKVWEFQRRRDPRHLLFYTGEELVAMASYAGLEVEREEVAGMTQDFDYWADTTSIRPEERAGLKQVFFNLALADQDRLDLVLDDGHISFTYPVVTLRARAE